MATKHDYIDHLFINGLYIPTRTVIYTGEVTQKAFSKIISALHVLSSTAGDITLILNSPGGCMSNGLAIYDAIRHCKNNRVRIVGYGDIMSMGTVILQAGDIRELSPNATIMLHEGYSKITESRIREVSAYARESERIRNRAWEILCRRMTPPVTIKQFLKRFDVDTYMDSESAVKLGLADRIKY
jgi:ATP-dependent Clp protease protease subunit